MFCIINLRSSQLFLSSVNYFLFILFSLATRAGTTHQRVPITVGPNSRPFPSNYRDDYSTALQSLGSVNSVISTKVV